MESSRLYTLQMTETYKELFQCIERTLGKGSEAFSHLCRFADALCAASKEVMDCSYQAQKAGYNELVKKDEEIKELKAKIKALEEQSNTCAVDYGKMF